MPRIHDDSEPAAQRPLDESAAVSPRLAERFVLEQLLGRGASGAVYRAHDRVRGATIAIKFLTALDPGSLFRFKSEFRTLANLAHPNLLQLYELLTFDDDWLLTMELIEGSDFLAYVRGPAAAAPSDPNDPAALSLATRVGFRSTRAAKLVSASPAAPQDPPLVGVVDASRLRSALLQLCEGLHALHRGGRLHRDLKPANVLVAAHDARLVICDFGLAIEGAQPPRSGTEPPGAERTADGSFGSTREREVAGTLAFMSPEQAQAQPLSPASDWYSVGVMLYQALTGTVPFSRSLTYTYAVRAKLSWRPIAPSEVDPSVPAELAELALALLRPDPAQRPGYAEIVAALEGAAPRAAPRSRPEHGFVGREAQKAALARAFSASQSGSAAIALVSGLSGMGKSALVDDFLTRLAEGSTAVVLRARCYEREELPYKALDPLMDALSSHLLALEPEALPALIPSSLQFLAALFPALRRVPAIAELPDGSASIPDPRERRRLAFRAFRELCARLASQRPLVLFIDDLQWGDLDSAPLFRELLAPPAPAVLIVCAYRSDDERQSPLLALLRDTPSLEGGAARLFEVSVGPLGRAEAERLALALLEPTAGAAEAAELIAREAEGSPFFVRELAAYANEHGVSAASRVHLDALIGRQLEALSRESRDLLAAIAVAGRPVAHAVIRAASGVGPAMFKALRDLEARRLVATSRAPEERAECSHDRIREAVCKAVAPELPAIHRALAEALEREAVEDCDALLEHWRAAGDRERARLYAERGARKAEAALAFTRAADLYREALSLLPPGDLRARELGSRLGHALILAGRGPEAAAVFLSLLPGASPAETLEFRMLAATQLLRGGKLAQAFEELARADDLFGVRFPESEPRAFAMLLARSVRIGWRRRRGDLRRAFATPRDPEVGARLEALWEVAAAVSNADLVRGSVYGAELMLRALDAGDPAHVAGACGLQAIAAAAANDTERCQKLLDVAAEAGRASGEPVVLGRVKGLQAICRQLEGRWLESIMLARTAQELHRSSTRFSWESAIMLWWEMASASYAGRISDMVARVPEALHEAEARGDVYAATSLRTYRSCWAWLGMDRPDLTELHVDTAEREWTPNGYQFQHWHMTYARAEVDLYRGTPQRSLARVRDAWRRGRLVRQVSAVRSDMLNERARLALAAARETRRPELLSLAARDANALIQTGKPWTVALGKLALAGVASAQDARAALALLAEAQAGFAAADMALHAAIARVRRGELLGAGDGRALVDAGLAEVQALGVKRPESFVQMLAPMPGPTARR